MAPAVKKEKKSPNTTMEGEKKRRSKKGKTGEFSRYIHKVLKQVHPELKISPNSMSIMNSFANDIFDRFAREAAKLVEIEKSKTMTSRDIQTATQLILSGQLVKHAVSEGVKAVIRYHTSKD